MVVHAAFGGSTNLLLHIPALAHAAASEAALASTAALLRARPEEIPERIRALLDERKAQAQEIVELFHSRGAAEDALADFEARFRQGAVPDDIPEFVLPLDGKNDASTT